MRLLLVVMPREEQKREQTSTRGLVGKDGVVAGQKPGKPAWRWLKQSLVYLGGDTIW